MQLSRKKIDIAIANSGYNINQLAGRAGISRQRLSILINQRDITPICAGKLAKALDVKVESLLLDED